ncbi:intersectin-1-like [Paramacrobiotus metropolitanus]|uniref:intersectin-1-like n=1 Tax=Paramacrobiotus metropolitanus TaxID=2943436 RepID=UPI002446091D|nr:intersectin-1-like [Paramacrobiotus metropolitanus]XP_055327259.1 intersectin-1-like [Paramacrobiotus metropolitanus]XP_055327260.1 intersectin-1-like [Paramacrobiotus metropolitanus]XP_055327261.1 intersectin-1-like [Paramacrobiotus metropolitanus]
MNFLSVQADQIPSAEKIKYHAHFLTLRSKDGIIDQSTARDFFLKSGLSHDILAKIWDASDRDKDGFLDLNEFCVAMHYVVNAIRQDKRSKNAQNGQSKLSVSPLPPVIKTSAPLLRSTSPPKNGSISSIPISLRGDQPRTHISTNVLPKLSQTPILPVRPLSPVSVLQPSLPAHSGKINLDRTTNGLNHVARYKEIILQKRKEVQQLHRDVQQLRSERNTYKDTLSELNKTRLADLRFLSEMNGTVRKKRHEVDELRTRINNIATVCSTWDSDVMQKQHLLTELRAANDELRSSEPVRRTSFSTLDSHIAQTLDRLERSRNVAASNEVSIELLGKTMRDKMGYIRSLVQQGAKQISVNRELCQAFEEKRTLIENLNTDTTSGSSYSVIAEDEETLLAIASYTGETANELSFVEGDIIRATEKHTDGWWLGENSLGNTGYFPANFCQALKTSDRRESVSELVKEENVRSALALYPYAAQNSDELSFNQHELIDIIPADGLDNDWYMGRSRTGERGLVPVNYLRLNSEMEKQPDAEPTPPVVKVSPKRQLAVRELIGTEEKYLNLITAVVQVYSFALKERHACTEDELSQLFSVWGDIIDCTATLVKAFNVRSKLTEDGALETVGDILCEYLPNITPYMNFCSSQVKMGELIREKTEANPTFAEVIRQCSQDPRMQGLPLAAAYMKPMQRMTQYPLLIKRILDLTPEHHPDCADLKEALRKSELLCDRVNEGVRATELTERLDWLDKHVNMDSFAENLQFTSQTNFMGPRSLVYAGSLLKAKSGRELVGFLFNDFFLLTTPPRPLVDSLGNFTFEKRQWTTCTLKLYKKPLLLSGCKVALLPDENTFALSFPHSVSILLKAPTANECKSWNKHFQKAVTDFSEMEKQINSPRNRSIKLHTPVGCCRLILVEGIDLCPSARKGHCDAFCKVSVGSQEQRTAVIENTINPKWDKNMTFIIYDLESEFLSLTVFDYNSFAANGFLGRTELRLKNMHKQTKSSNMARSRNLVLQEVMSGELVVKIDIQLFPPESSVLPAVMPLMTMH